MKATRLIIALLVVAMAATGAFATCIPAKTFTNFNTIENPGSYFYILFDDVTLTSADLTGRFWETGNRAASNEGSYDDSAWLLENYYYPDTGSWYLNGNLGDGGVVGCPVGALTLTVEDTKNGDFVSMAIQEDPPRSVTFDYSKLGTDTPAVAMPRPMVTQSSRTGDTVTVDISVADASAGVYNGDTADGANITAVVIYQNSVPEDVDPAAPFDRDINSGAWTQVASTTNGGTIAGLAIDCSGADQALAAAVEINGVGGASVSDRTIVECTGNLADPSGKFKLIDKPSKPGNGKPVKRR